MFQSMQRFQKALAMAYRQACAILGCAPVEGHISGVVDIPNACAALWLPTGIFDFDINPCADGPKKMVTEGMDVPLSKDKE
nr:acetamidase/formamidase family protein [Marinobacter antarcticus]